MNSVSHYTNTRGRDFIVGDLHGSLAMLETLLRHVGFDAARDRLFSVGDLVDRGADSAGCLALLDEPWFFAVLGNHEEMMAANDSDWMRNGGGWIFGVSQDARPEVNRLIEKAGKLPLWRTVELPGNRRFHVVHAELFPGDSNAGNRETRHFALESDAEISGLESLLSRYDRVAGYPVTASWATRLTWGRSVIVDAFKRKRYARWGGLQPGCSPIFCGHTIIPNTRGQVQLKDNLNVPWPVVVHSHVFIDGGAYEAYKDKRQGLALVEPAAQRGWFLFGNGEISEFTGDWYPASSNFTGEPL